MLSEHVKEELNSSIETLKEKVIELHTYIEDNTSIDHNTFKIIDGKVDSILLKINQLENEIYFT